MKLLPPNDPLIISAASPRRAAFTLTEVVMAMAIIVTVFSGILVAYITTAARAQWTGYSLAAQALAIQQIEQARASVWDISLNKNEITNLNLMAWTSDGAGGGKGYCTNILDLPTTGGAAVVVTNFVTVKMITLTWSSSNSPVQVQMVQVDTVWPMSRRGVKKFYTNSTATYYGPDNRDPNTL